MKFYFCNKKQLVGTQAEAKKLDPDYTETEVPTDKQGLMDYINDLLALIPRNDQGDPIVLVEGDNLPAASDPNTPSEAAEAWFEKAEVVQPASSEWKRCPKCGRTQKAAQLIADIEDKEEICRVIRADDGRFLGSYTDAVIDNLRSMKENLNIIDASDAG